MMSSIFGLHSLVIKYANGASERLVVCIILFIPSCSTPTRALPIYEPALRQHRQSRGEILLILLHPSAAHQLTSSSLSDKEKSMLCSSHHNHMRRSAKCLLLLSCKLMFGCFCRWKNEGGGGAWFFSNKTSRKKGADGFRGLSINTRVRERCFERSVIDG